MVHRLHPVKQPLEFFKPDMQKFRCLALAYQAIDKGGNIPCIMNAANEIVNKAFLEDRCRFLRMSEIIEQAMDTCTYIKTPTYDELIASDREASRVAAELL